MLSYVRSLPASSELGKAAAVDTIAMALRLPSIFDFDPLFKLDPVIAVKDHELFSLLQIFLNGGLSEFSVWAGSHAGAFEKYRQ
jgi:translation initiation factor 3 subunit M